MNTKQLVFLAILAFPFQSFSQIFLESKQPIFKRFDTALSHPLKELLLDDLDGNPGQEIVVLERMGEYPNWKLKIVIHGFKDGKIIEVGQIPVPSEALFYGFVPVAGEPKKPLILVRPGMLEAYFFPTDWATPVVKSVKIDAGYETSQLGLTSALDFNPMKSSSQIWIPARTGIKTYELKHHEIKPLETLALEPRAYYQTSGESAALDLPFWAKGSFWFPIVHQGSLNGKDPALFFPWIDEVQVFTPRNAPQWRTHYFRRLSEEERQDGQSNVIVRAVDLNGDGRTDFLINKFKGAAASLSAETTVHLTKADGSIDTQGLKLVPEGNRAAGAVAVDLNRDGKMELAVASSQFNAWAIARALTQGQVKVKFSFYSNSGELNLNQPNFTREILFGFDLGDLDIEGLLPTLEGDFNGDGYPDALYAKNRRSLTVLVQKPRGDEIFAAVPTGEYDVSVLRKFRIGDLNGDGKSDVVMYDRKSKANLRFTTLLNTGVLK